MSELSSFIDVRAGIEGIGVLLLALLASKTRRQRQHQSDLAAAEQQRSLAQKTHLQDQLQTLRTENQTVTATLVQAEQRLEGQDQQTAHLTEQVTLLQQQLQTRDQDQQDQQSS